MSDTAAARFRRLVTILPRLADGNEFPLSALAEASGVAPRVILGDLQALCDRFDDLPGHDDGIGVLIEGDRVAVRTDHFHRPMRLTAAELCALELGLAVLLREGPAKDEASVRELLARLAHLITRLPRDASYHGLRDGAMADRGGADLLPLIRTALRAGAVVEIEYQRAHDDVASSRTVRPYALLFNHGSWYLVGWCEQSDALRNFRVDRIVTITLTDRKHPVPDGFDAFEAMPDGRPGIARSPAVLSVRFSPVVARWIAERDGLPLEHDGSALRTFPLADREWAVRHLLQYGPDVEVLEPREVRDELVERLQRIMR